MSVVRPADVKDRPIWLKRSVALSLLAYADRPVRATTRRRDTIPMMVIGIDAHKRSHTAVTIDDNGRVLATKTVGTTTQDHLRLVKWAGAADGKRLWAIEDCRHLTRRLERDLIGGWRE
jgi:hypothetical protein